MDALLEIIKNFMVDISVADSLFITIFILSTVFSMYLYFLIRSRTKLKKVIIQNEKVLQKSFDVSKDGILKLSNKYKILYANPAMINFLELDDRKGIKEFKMMPHIKIKHSWIGLDQFIKEQFKRSKKEVILFPQTYLRTTLNVEHELLTNLYLGSTFTGGDNGKWESIISIQDLSREKEQEERALRHDLTNLPNQNKVFHDLPSLYSKVHQGDSKIALVLIRLDNFTMLRSIIGYEQSTEVLIKFAKYLETIVTELNISVYHTFDNHFLLTLANVKTNNNVIALMDEIQKKVATFYKMEDVNLHLTMSAGIAVYPDSGTTRKLLDNTYKALAEAQKEGDGRIHLYIPPKVNSKYDDLTLHNHMQGSLEKGEFEVYYQPIVQVSNEEIVAAEALIRWIHPEYGFIRPDIFISLMEKSGFIIKLGKFILETVLRQQKRWEIFKFKQIQVSINVSMVEIGTGEFVEHIAKKMEYHKVDPATIKFEITEGTAMMNEIETEKLFASLKKLGVGISLDDFGTGYTSFTYLKKFPADVLKIDKTLIDYILTSEEDQRIVKGMIELGHNLGMKIVVEGVENREMVDMLASYDCDYIQGFYFSRPLPVFEFQELLRK